ncbi:MAG TPA: VOC family protein [Acidimicrobiia bacterium]|nr:VOC family protein [Acidimicrobiia bacterium]
MGSAPAANRPKFSHLGIAAVDLPAMEEFYTELLGMVVTDRGNTAGLDVVFLSGDPAEHHQLVLASGRPRTLPPNEANPAFGAVINQISFRLDDLAAMKALNQRLAARGVELMMTANHGVSLSIYFPDPDGNMVEAFVDTEWYCEQPVLEPFDLTQSDEEILGQANKIAESGQNFMPIEKWRAGITTSMERAGAR